MRIAGPIEAGQPCCHYDHPERRGFRQKAHEATFHLFGRRNCATVKITIFWNGLPNSNVAGDQIWPTKRSSLASLGRKDKSALCSAEEGRGKGPAEKQSAKRRRFRWRCPAKSGISSNNAAPRAMHPAPRSFVKWSSNILQETMTLSKAGEIYVRRNLPRALVRGVAACIQSRFADQPDSRSDRNPVYGASEWADFNSVPFKYDRTIYLFGTEWRSGGFQAGPCRRTGTACLSHCAKAAARPRYHWNEWGSDHDDTFRFRRMPAMRHGPGVVPPDPFHRRSDCFRIDAGRAAAVSCPAGWFCGFDLGDEACINRGVGTVPWSQDPVHRLRRNPFGFKDGSVI